MICSWFYTWHSAEMLRTGAFCCAGTKWRLNTSTKKTKKDSAQKRVLKLFAETWVMLCTSTTITHSQTRSTSTHSSQLTLHTGMLAFLRSGCQPNTWRKPNCDGVTRHLTCRSHMLTSQTHSWFQQLGKYKLKEAIQLHKGSVRG